jgi:tryptophan synthase alpha chain
VNRPLAGLFSAAAAEGRAVLMPYLMAGIPSRAASVDLFAAMADAGADAFEVGIPYSDPLMDGPVIQRAGAEALRAGTTLAEGFRITAAVKERTGLPCIVMTYSNPVFHEGPGVFAARAAEAGADALIVADLPVDEAAPVSEAAEAHGMGLVVFAAPTTSDERLRKVAEANPPFVYGIAEMGVTGERVGASTRAAELAARVRGVTDVPLVLGVGISTPEAARAAAELADGVIVGSALVRRVLEADDAGRAALSLRDAVAAFREAMPKSIASPP